jgi:hypothetical protein
MQNAVGIAQVIPPYWSTSAFSKRLGTAFVIGWRDSWFATTAIWFSGKLSDAICGPNFSSSSLCPSGVACGGMMN